MPAAYETIRDFQDDLNVFEIKNPLAFATTINKKMKKGEDPDMPTFEQVMHSGKDLPQWLDAIKKEIHTLIRIGTWTVVPRSYVRDLTFGPVVVEY